MTIKEFCRVRPNIQVPSVIKYMKRRSDLFEGHISGSGQQTELDDVAIKLLEEKYPMPMEVISSPNAELIAELDRAKNYIIQLQQEAIQHEKLMAKAELDKVMLEERRVQLLEETLEVKAVCNDLQGQNAALHEELGRLKAQLEQAEQEASRASQEAEKLRSRSFWQRVFNT